jgi:hypothetical protein
LILATKFRIGGKFTIDRDFQSMIRRSCTLAGSGAALTREAASAEFKRAEPAAGQRGNIRFNTSSLSIKWLLFGMLAAGSPMLATDHDQ